MSRPRAARAVAVGLAAGVAYAVVNRAFDVRTAYGSLPTALAPVHAFVDQVLPLIAGALLGLAAHYVRLRARLAREERARVEELESRLRGVERDQAAWVLAASVLHEVKNPLHSLGLVLDELPHAKDEQERADLVAKAQAQIGRVDERLAELRRLPTTIRGPRICVQLGLEGGHLRARFLQRSRQPVASPERASTRTCAYP